MAMVMIRRGKRRRNGAEIRRAVAATRRTDGVGRRSRRDGDRERQGTVLLTIKMVAMIMMMMMSIQTEAKREEVVD